MSKQDGNTNGYELIYWPGFPGRGEFVRLAFEVSGTPYKDICNEQEDGVKQLLGLISSENSSGFPLLAPPLLRVQGIDNGEGTGPLTLHQTPNILIYLAGKLGLSGGDDEGSQAVARQVMLTALDLNSETHDTHHPVATMDYYEDQKTEALRAATNFRNNRIPKYFKYFELALRANEVKGQYKYFVGDKTSIADIAVWQVLDGLKFAFPKEIAIQEADFPLLTKKFYPAFKEREGIKEYLASDRRKQYSNGIFRHYPELDRQE